MPVNHEAPSCSLFAWPALAQPLVKSSRPENRFMNQHNRSNSRSRASAWPRHWTWLCGFVAALVGWCNPDSPRARAEEPKERITLRGHTDSVYCVAIAADGTVASGSRDGAIILWDLKTGQPKRWLEAHRGSGYTQVVSLAFAPQGKNLAS